MTTVYAFVPSPKHEYPDHPERPGRLDELIPKLGSFQAEKLDLVPAKHEEIARVHVPRLITGLERVCREEAPGVIDYAPTYVTKTSFNDAMLAAGAGLMVIGFLGTFFGNLIKASVSRQREFFADASAVQFTRNPGGIAGALKRIGGFDGGSILQSPNAPESSHLFFSQGLRGGLQMLFATQVDSYQLLPSWAVLFVARSLPWFELTLGILLLVGFGLRWVSLVTTLFVAALFGVILRTYFAGLQINCGCFGPGAEPLNGWTILRDGLFLALAAAVTTGAFLQARAAHKTDSESVVDFL